MAEMKAEMSVNQIGDSKVGTHKNVRVLKDVQTTLVEFVDRDGTKQTKLAIILAGQEVRFISDDVFSAPVAKWLSDSILIALGHTPKKD